MKASSNWSTRGIVARLCAVGCLVSLPTLAWAQAQVSGGSVSGEAGAQVDLRSA